MNDERPGSVRRWLGPHGEIGSERRLTLAIGDALDCTSSIVGNPDLPEHRQVKADQLLHAALAVRLETNLLVRAGAVGGHDTDAWFDLVADATQIAARIEYAIGAVVRRAVEGRHLTAWDGDELVAAAEDFTAWVDQLSVEPEPDGDWP